MLLWYDKHTKTNLQVVKAHLIQYLQEFKKYKADSWIKDEEPKTLKDIDKILSCFCFFKELSKDFFNRLLDYLFFYLYFVNKQFFV